MKNLFGTSKVGLAIAGCVCSALFAAGISSGAAKAATSKQKTFTVYAVVTEAQFMNHADDRVRGMSANPFTPNQQTLVVVENGSEKKKGPFPGDDVLYTFKLYPSAKLEKSTGTALFTCYYNFNTRATCEAYFELGSSTLLASGQIVFNSTRFTLAVVGGTNTYLAEHGEVAATPAAGKGTAQRLNFVLLGS